jgi:hypothetical protein
MGQTDITSPNFIDCELSPSQFETDRKQLPTTDLAGKIQFTRWAALGDAPTMT